MKSLASDIDSIPTDSRFLFNNFLTCSSGGTSNEMLFGQGVSSYLVKVDAMLSLPTSIVSPSLEYIQNIPIKLLPPFSLHKFDSIATQHLKTSYMTFLPSFNEDDIPQLCRRHKCALWFSEHLSCSKCLCEILYVCKHIGL